MNSLIEKVGIDKILHFLVGALIVALLAPVSSRAALWFAIVAAFGKESYDYFRYGKADARDACATLLGAATAFACTFALSNLQFSG